MLNASWNKQWTKLRISQIAATLCVLGSVAEAAPVPQKAPITAFKAVWGYLMRGAEKDLTGSEPVTDLFYFGVNLNRSGRIPNAIPRPTVTMKNGLTPQIHLVIAELSNYSLLHFSLDPEYGVTPQLIDDISRISAPFDGVQIDFEAVAHDDAAYFFDFLTALKAKLPAGKTLSVAAPARAELVQDAYEYSRLAAIADQIVIMAYDEHWSTSAPGPVASLPWCSKVADYVTGVIGTDKVIMGLPLYGRAWQDKRLAVAMSLNGVENILSVKKRSPSYASDLGAYFEYAESVVVKVFYDDARTINDKLQAYRAKNIDAVAFWHMGLGSPDLWDGVVHPGPAPRPRPARPALLGL